MNRVAELRKKEGWSQSELASYVGLAQNTISQYESGQRNLSSRMILELSNLFGVSPGYLLGESDGLGEIRPTPHDLQLATKIIAEDNVSKVNLYLRKGWRLVHIGEERHIYDTGEVSSSIVYSLAWFDHPQHLSAEELPSDTDADIETW